VAREADSRPRAVAAGLWVYCCLLRLYPREFQGRYTEELENDFLVLSLDAWQQGGSAALARWWTTAAVDTGRSLCAQWLRTPWVPMLIVAACVAAGVFWGVIGRAQLPLRAFRRVVVPMTPEPPPDSPALLLLMALMVLIPIAGVLVFWCVSRLVRHGSPTRRRRA
jgi:hypothetical protein